MRAIWRRRWKNPWTNAALRVHSCYPKARRYCFSTPPKRFLKRLEPGPRSTRRNSLRISSRMSSRPSTIPGEPYAYVRSNDERCSKHVPRYVGPTIQAIGVPSSSRAEAMNSPSRARSSEEDARNRLTASSPSQPSLSVPANQRRWFRISSSTRLRARWGDSSTTTFNFPRDSRRRTPRRYTFRVFELNEAKYESHSAGRFTDTKGTDDRVPRVTNPSPRISEAATQVGDVGDRA